MNHSVHYDTICSLFSISGLVNFEFNEGILCFAQFQLKSAGETSMLYGGSEGNVFRQWKEESRIVRYWFTPWKVDSLAVTPFNRTCIGARTLDNKDFKIRLMVRG